MPDRGLITSRVMSVKGDCDVKLENGDYLEEIGIVKVIPRLGGDANAPSMRPFNEYECVISEWDKTEVY